MDQSVRAAARGEQAKGVARRSHAPRLTSPTGRTDATALSPTLEAEIGAALQLCQGNLKAEAVAWEFGWDRATYYRRLQDPLDLTIRDFLRLLVKVPDPKFNARVRGHLAALDAYQAVAEREAGATYVRITRGGGQPGLPFEGDR